MRTKEAGAVRPGLGGFGTFVFIRVAWASSGRGAIGGAGCLALLVLLLFAARAEAATRTWDGGCGAETAWSCAANWSENTAPGPTDTALFNATSTHSSTVDVGFLGGKVGSVTINPGYTGTISLSRSLTVAVGFTQKTGTFTAGGQALSTKNFTLSGGAFTASSAITSIAGTLKISGGTFGANGGLVDFSGGSGALSCNGVSFNEVTISNISGTKTVGSKCSLPLGPNPTAGSGGSVTLNGTLTGTGTLTSARKLTLGAGGSLSGFSGLASGALTVNGAYGFGEYEPFEVTGKFTVGAAGGFTAPEGPASFGGSFIVSSASTFDANSGTIEFDGEKSFTMACGSKTFNLVTFSAGHKTINSDCTLPLGSNPDLGTGGTRLKGTLSGSGVLTQSGTFEIESGAPGLNAFSDVVDVGALLLKTGTVLTAPSGELTVQGNFTVSSGVTFNAGSGTVNFAGSGKATKYLTCNGVVFNQVKLTNTTKQVVGSGCTLPLGEAPTVGEGGPLVVNGTLKGSGTLETDTLTFTLGATGVLSGFSGLETGTLVVNGPYDFGEYETLAVGGSFTLNSGASFAAPESIASFAGDFVNAGGSFDANGGTVELTGADQQINGSTTFFGLEKVAEAEGTLTFAAGATQTIEGALVLKGAGAGERLNLVSSGSPTRWLIEAKGSREVEFVSVKDSEALGTAIEALESFDAGNNSGWEFL